MPDKKTLVINTGPILSLIAGTGDLKILQSLYDKVFVPYEVCQEILSGGKTGFAVNEFHNDSWITKLNDKTILPTFLSNSLDIGEASVIETALQNNIPLVCIDEAVGRRVALKFKYTHQMIHSLLLIDMNDLRRVDKRQRIHQFNQQWWMRLGLSTLQSTALTKR